MNDLDTKRLRLLLGLKPDSPDVSDRDIINMAELCLLLTLPNRLSPDEIPDAESIIQMQIWIGQILAAQYNTGNPTLGIAYDPAKAKKYAGLHNPDNIGKQTETVYDAFGWFTAVRLFTVRLMRTLRLMNLIPALVIFNHISTLTSICGLSYGIELVVEISVMIKTAFSDDLNGTRWSRFKAAFWKDNRPHRLSNAFVWFSVNFACFFLTGGISALLNTTLFVFDVFNDSWKAWREISAWRRFEKTLDNNVRNPDSDRQFVVLLSMTRSRISNLKRTHALKISITITVLIGMVFIFFPPAGLSAAIGLYGIHVTGALMTLAGSILGGLGRRLFQLFSSPTHPSSPSALHPTQENAPIAVSTRALSSASPSPMRGRVSTIHQLLAIDEDVVLLNKSESQASMTEINLGRLDSFGNIEELSMMYPQRSITPSVDQKDTADSKQEQEVSTVVSPLALMLT